MSLPPPSDDQEARTQRHLAVLDTLIAQGTDFATRLHQQSTTPSDLCSALAAPGLAIPFITPDVIAAFAQINQTIRRAILVSRKLTEPLPLARPTRPIQRNPEATRPESIRTEAAERIHSPSLEDRIGSRPIPEIIAGLARDLGLDSMTWVRQPAAPADDQPAMAPAQRPRTESPGDNAEPVATNLRRRTKPEFRPPKRKPARAQ